MAEIVRNETIRYRNESFAIHHLIADCPPFTVVRELLKNAEENAASLMPPGRIEWFIEEVGGFPKLGLFNEGPGMSGDDLARLMDLASTGKTLGLNNNYGQGGKISALKTSPEGVIYRSCNDGRVCQIILGAEQRPGLDFPTYVKKRHPAKLEEMCGRAAMYQREENAALLNPRHFKYLDDLDKFYADAGADTERRALAKRLFDEEYCFNAGRFVILAWLFKGKPNWDDREWEEALSMGSLTVHLAEPASLDEARRRFRMRLNSRKIGALS